MDLDELNSLVVDLAENVDDLEAVLAPLTSKALSTSTSKLPLLDKAKLYILATYSIESMLFSALRLSGVDARSHPVFKELSRVKDYFAKVKLVETGPVKRNTTLDKDAAGRFIKAGLSGNDRIDRERSGRKGKEQSGGKRRFEDMLGVGSHIRFEGTAKRIRAAEEGGQPSSELSEDSQQPLPKQEIPHQAIHAQTRSQPHQSLGTSDEAHPAAAKSRSKHSKSSRPPKSANEAFQALTGGSATAIDDGKHKKKKKNRED